MNLHKQKKCLWAQLTLPSITLSGVDQAPNQRLVFPMLYGPFMSSRAFFHRGKAPLPTSDPISDPLVERSFTVVLLFAQDGSPRKKRENDLGGNRTPDLRVFCPFVKDKPLSHSISHCVVLPQLQPHRRSENALPGDGLLGALATSESNFHALQGPRHCCR